MSLDVLHTINAALAVVALFISLFRVWQGPTIIDRNIATDVLSAGVIACLVVVIVAWRRQDLAVVLIIVALTAFLSSLVVARYIRRDVVSSDPPSLTEHTHEADSGELGSDELMSDDDEDESPTPTVGKTQRTRDSRPQHPTQHATKHSMKGAQ